MQIEMKGINKYFTSNKVLKNAAFSLKDAEVHALMGEYGAFIALAALFIILSAVSAEFRQPTNLLNLLRQASFNGLIAVGMTCVILSDGIDLSVGSTFALSAVVCAELLIMGIPAGLAIIIALVVGTLLGTFSGLLVTKGRLQPFIATIITRQVIEVLQ